MKKNCKSCAYGKKVAKNENYECRRYPPRVQFVPQHNHLNNKTEMAGISVFAQVNETIDCGEFKTRLAIGG